MLNEKKYGKSCALFVTAMLIFLLFAGCAGEDKEPVVSEPVKENTNHIEMSDEIAQPEEAVDMDISDEETNQPSEDDEEVIEPSQEQEKAPEKDIYQTDPVPEGKPVPVEPQDVTLGSGELRCTISISCATVLNNMDKLDPDKDELVPEDGWILEPLTVIFHEGESVFNVLQRTCKQQKIHMEYEDTPIYNSAYIEGINNIYEFDAGDISGWMYKVNDWFPNYGCSRYQLKDGDNICWVYTCDLGRDVGGDYSAGNIRG